MNGDPLEMARALTPPQLRRRPTPEPESEPEPEPPKIAELELRQIETKLVSLNYEFDEANASALESKLSAATQLGASPRASAPALRVADALDLRERLEDHLWRFGGLSQTAAEAAAHDIAAAQLQVAEQLASENEETFEQRWIEVGRGSGVSRPRLPCWTRSSRRSAC